jgi:hypothetical protein
MPRISLVAFVVLTARNFHIDRSARQTAKSVNQPGLMNRKLVRVFLLAGACVVLFAAPDAPT